MNISIILTIYNKALYLPYTLPLLCKEIKNLDAEIICIDDNSKDNSVEIIEKLQQKHKNLFLINNKDNLGPAIRLNQAVKSSNGKYLFLIDADDILRPNALKKCYDLMKKNNADLLYGGYQHETKRIEDLLPKPLEENIEDQFISHKSALNRLVDKSYTRMRLMLIRELFDKSGGADEKIFIQDESLPIRLGVFCKNFIEINQAIIQVPLPSGEHLSDNKNQQHYDRFYAYYNLLKDNELPKKIKYKIYRQIIASYWKSSKKNTKGINYLTAFVNYIKSKIPLLLIHKFKPDNFEPYINYMESLGNVRKIKK